jgi:hypothetical protein
MGSSDTIRAVRLPIAEDIPMGHELDYIRDSLNHLENGHLVVFLVLSDPTVFEHVLHPIRGLNAITNGAMRKETLASPKHAHD